MRFAERPGTDPAMRPIREIVGVDPRLNQRWSTRRAHIESRRGELAIQFQNDHGRPPTPVEALRLAQVDEVLDRRSVALAPPHDGIEEPEVLRRVDGTSVYTVAGANLYTSQRILDAEQRLLTTAGRRDGSAVDQMAVDLALLEMAANGSTLNAGQASLVRQMCTSGARLQLAIAPAGAGKPPPCAPSPWPGPMTAATRSASPPPPQRLPCSASRPASAPTRSPNSPGHLITVSSPTGRRRSVRRHC